MEVTSPPAPLVCHQCHVPVRTTDYFCYNCGANLRPKPLSTSLGTQLLYYIGSVILMPMGIIWGYRYIKQPNSSAKIIGWVLIFITIITMAVVTKWTIDLINNVNDQVNQQLQMMNY